MCSIAWWSDDSARSDPGSGPRCPSRCPSRCHGALGRGAGSGPCPGRRRTVGVAAAATWLAARPGCRVRRTGRDVVGVRSRRGGGQGRVVVGDRRGADGRPGGAGRGRRADGTGGRGVGRVGLVGLGRAGGRCRRRLRTGTDSSAGGCRTGRTQAASTTPGPRWCADLGGWSSVRPRSDVFHGCLALGGDRTWSRTSRCSDGRGASRRAACPSTGVVHGLAALIRRPVTRARSGRLDGLDLGSCRVTRWHRVV